MHTINNKNKLIARIRKIQGQSKALERLLEQENKCDEVLQQIAAIKGAINGLMYEVMQGHLVEHVAKQSDLAQREKEAEFLNRIIKSYLK